MLRVFNIKGLRETKLVVFSGASHYVLIVSCFLGYLLYTWVERGIVVP